MSTIDQQFVEYVIKSLVEHPDDVVVERMIDEKGVLLTLTVNPEDLGRVIGKRGGTAQSVRTLLRALGTKNDARYNLKIVDIDRPESERGTPRRKPAPVDDATAPVAAVSAADDDDVDNVPEKPVEKESDLAKKTRAELADLDDLDI
jgi:predicted RNA-binding protein YlqC (UPF0109 family)